MKITAEQKAIIIAGFGKHYTEKAINYLTQQEVFNSQAEPFTKPALKHIIAGKTENVIVVDTLVSKAVEMLEAAKQNTKQIKRKAYKLLK